MIHAAARLEGNAVIPGPFRGGTRLSSAPPLCSPRAPARLADATVDRHRGERVREDVRQLASDDFEGRRPGTPGADKTVAFLVEQFRKLGLNPATATAICNRSVGSRSLPAVTPLCRLPGPAAPKCWNMARTW